MSVTGSDCLVGETIKSGNVTSADRELGTPIKSGNDSGAPSLEAVEAKLHEMLGATHAGGNDPAEVAKREERRETRRLQYRARRDGGLCSKCGRGLKTDEAVYIAVVWAGHRPLTGTYGRHYGPVCEGCAPPYMKGEGRYYNPRIDRCEQRSCDTCERPVVWKSSRRDYYRRHVFCSERCQWSYYNTARNERAAHAREKVCEVCNETFTAARRDAKTCSSACKQKAYRRRKDGAA